MRYLATIFLLLALAPAALAAPETVVVTRAAGKATIENARVRVTYDLARGTYSAVDKRDGAVCLAGAYVRAGELASNAPGWKHSASERAVRDALGSGRALTIRSTQAGKPALLLEIALYPGSSFVALREGIENTTGKEFRLKEFHPLTGAEAFPGLMPKENARTLDGYGGSGDTRVLKGLSHNSANNVLLTFTAAGKRRSLVLGGLAYRDFLKFARTGGGGFPDEQRRTALRKLMPDGRLAAYLDCGDATDSAGEGGPALRVVAGESFTWEASQQGAADPWFGSVTFDNKEVAFEASGLDPAKGYVLGFSWWDFDANGRKESVWAVAPDGKRIPLLPATLLPAFRGKQAPPEERAVALPRAAYASGKVRLAFTSEAQVPNACVSEVWLWETPGEATAPAALASGRPAGHVQPEAGDTRVGADLKAQDPVGRRVDAGERYFPADRFYVDFATDDPFQALEQYGLRVRAAQGAKPNPYDFPTVCAWYVGLFGYGQAQNRPEKSKYLIATSAGLVEEADCAQKSGFLNYSRAAMRLVPDTYVADNEQGWWDDAHWQKYLHYTPPYETTRKYCQGIRERGCLPFTYFQCCQDARDFREKFPDLMLGKSPQRTLDYTNPAAQAHMRKVYANLRAGGMAGMMFDYPDTVWGAQLVRGGFADPHATAADAYRMIFTLAKQGLGPDSWIHERVLGDPLSDLTAGVVDSQRVWGDTAAINAHMISRCGLRWYKNRVLFAYDMDAKNLLDAWKRAGIAATDQDGRRMLLTMAYVAASRLLLATSFRDMPPDVLYDLERTYPYHKTPQSARPVDAFTADGWPQVYDFAVSPTWHQVTLFNNAEPAGEAEISVALSDAPADGGLGLDPAKEYYAYDFWNDRFAGRLKGAGRLTEKLRAGEARMLSLHQVEPHPQFVSTNRHLMQGYVDMEGEPAWDAAKQTLSGISKVVGGETYKVVIAGNGRRPASATAAGAKASIEPAADGLFVLKLDTPDNATVKWSVRF